MDPELAVRLRTSVAQQVGLAPDVLRQPGTTVAADRDQGADGWVTLWPAGDHVVVEVPVPLHETVRGLAEQLPPQHRLTADDLTGAWPGRDLEVEHDPFTVLDPMAFRPAPPPTTATVRRLDEDDRAAFEAFLARCPQADRDEADVDVGHGLAAGVVVDGSIVAVASVYRWCGFDDIGVLSDPAHRRRGYAAAAVSAVCTELLDRPVAACYRYDADNTASSRVAASLGLVPVGPLVRLRPAV